MPKARFRPEYSGELRHRSPMIQSKSDGGGGGGGGGGGLALST